MKEKIVEKKCIFHVPTNIFVNGDSGSTVRPKKMKAAFENIGYEVDYIWGYGCEREKSIKKIRENIEKGIKYDFLYAENSTLPTLLTEKNHIPKYLKLDFEFFKFCKKHSIPIALFYRDIYWNAPDDAARKATKSIAKLFYVWDLIQYKRFVDIFYLPSLKMLKWIPIHGIDRKQICLYPGGESRNDLKSRSEDYMKADSRSIRIFYVGGISGLYDLSGLMEIACTYDFVYLTVCCRKSDWEKHSNLYQKYLNKRIKIVHETGEGLKTFYEEADICSLYFPPFKYREITMPVKVFEYLSYGVPIIATRGSLAETFITENDVGWGMEFNKEKTADFLLELSSNKEIIKNKRRNIDSVMKRNTWESRAEQVVKEIKEI